MTTIQTQTPVALQPTLTKEEPAPEPREPPEGLSHTSYVTIWNNTDYQLQLTGQQTYEGKFVDGPSQLIDRLGSDNNKGFLKMEKKFGMYGTKGEVWYSTTDGKHQVRMNFGCPASDDNYTGASPSEGSPKVVTGPFDKSGDLIVAFSVIN